MQVVVESSCVKFGYELQKESFDHLVTEGYLIIHSFIY